MKTTKEIVSAIGSMLIVLATLLACNSTPTTRGVMLPDGRQGYEIGCDGGLQSMSDCMNRASALCHGPYDVITGGEHTTYGEYYVPSPVEYKHPGSGYYQQTSRVSRSLIVACK